MNDAEFLAVVRDEMSTLHVERGIPNEGDQFSVWFATEIMKEDIVKVVDEYHIGGAGDNRIDIAVSDEDHEVQIIAQCKFTQNLQGASFNKDLIDEVLSARNRLNTLPDEGNNKRRRFARTYNQSSKPVRLLAVGLGPFVPSSIDYAQANDVEVYDFERIKKRYSLLNGPGGQRPPELLTFSIGHGKSVDRSNSYKLVSFLTSAKQIWSAVDKYRDSLFQENLRYRLEGAVKGKIGEDIETTVKTSPQHLDLLNNGITIVARRLDDDNPTQVKVYDPQVVNGGQTCWAIFDALEELRMTQRVDDVNPLILVRAIETNDPGLIQRITFASNTQNVISHRDRRSPDPLQRQLSLAFDRNTPRILYEHRDGLFGAIERQGQSTVYRVSGRTFRRLDNVLCGQLYLALMGLPHRSKADKKMIMADDDVYDAIFQFGRASELRFRNDEVRLTPPSLKLRSGTSTIFVEDILFAFGVHSLAHAIGQVYQRKVDILDRQGRRGTNVSTNLLNHDFMTAWEFYLVASVNYIVERISQNDHDRRRIQAALIGNNVNRFWQNLQNDFNMNPDLESYVVLDESNPSVNFGLFSRWAIQIANMLAQAVSELKARNEWQSTRHFLDLTDTTYLNLISKLDTVLGGPMLQRNQTFPVPQ
jgi:hypothetical protein